MFEIVFAKNAKTGLDSYVSVKQKWAALVTSVEPSTIDDGAIDIICKRKDGTVFALQGVSPNSPYLETVKNAESESYYVIFYKDGHISFEPKASLEENSMYIENGR